MFVDFLRRLNNEGRRWLEIVPDPVPVFLSHHVVFFTGVDLGGCEDCCNVRRRLRSAGGSATSTAACRKRALDECSADCSTTDDLQDDVMHKVHIQLHSGQDAIRIQVNPDCICPILEGVPRVYGDNSGMVFYALQSVTRRLKS